MCQFPRYFVFVRQFVPAVLVLALAACATSDVPAPVVNRSLDAPHVNAPVYNGANRRAAGKVVDASSRPEPAQPPLAGAQVPQAAEPVVVADADAEAIESVPVRSGRIESSPIAGDSGAGAAPVITMTPVAGNGPPPVAAAGGNEQTADTSPPAAGNAPAVPPVAANQAGTEASPPASAAASSSRPFIWPAKGAVTKSFTDPKSMGIAIAGKAGDPVAAAAKGEVIFSGLGPRGYGKLLIVRHDSELLSVYANNRVLLAKEGQMVKQGEKIAEVGAASGEEPRLHFEVRRLGKPVDPIAYLPPSGS